MATLDLLSEFPAVSTEAWERAIHDDLKGADYVQRLVWHSPEGIDVKPYYRAEDVAGLEFLDSAPGDYPYVRGTRSAGGWRIREEIDAVEPEEANSAARCAVAAGAEEIAFCGATVAGASDLGMLLANLEEIPVRFECVDMRTAHLIVERMTKRPGAVMVSAGLDWSADPEASADLIAKAPPQLLPFTIQAEELQEKGATAVEEVGFALAAGVDFMAAMQERGLAVNRVTDSITFSFAMGPELIMQVAKLRAFRMLWAQAVESFGGAREQARARVYARTSRWNRTAFDPHVNMLRGATEAMSAILGGADSIYVAPFDECYRAPDEASRRLARNTQSILKQEALLSHVADPAGGSYFLEALTNSIGERAWELLQEIEAGGGYLQARARIAEVLEGRKIAQQETVRKRQKGIKD